ncbi:MAG: alpha-L-fucosidase [Niabella sp.]
MLARCFLITLLFVLYILPVHAQWSVKEGYPVPKGREHNFNVFTETEWNASNFASKKNMKWFEDARYGMFMCFGLSTYIGKDLSWQMCYTHKLPDGGRGPIPDSVWVTYPQHLVFEKFDATKLVETAKQAGMKYIVVVAKHHDGFHLWDTKYSDFKITNTPYGKDYLKEIADACHVGGMKFGIYYSQRDWYHPDYMPVDTSLVVRISKPPFYKAKEGVTQVKPGLNHQKYINYQFNVVRELCTNYGKVDVFWFDALWYGGMFTAEMWDAERLTTMIRQLQPEIIINNRTSVPGDYDTPEQRIGMYQQRPWESCMTLNHTWSWSNTPTKSKTELIKLLTATATGNGNMLMSWGPKWDGEFDSLQVSRLEEVGDWLKKFGNTMYSTKGGPWYPAKWGGATYRNNKAFVHITDLSLKELILPALPNTIISVKCITGGNVTYKKAADEWIFDLSNAGHGNESVIVEINFKNPVKGMVDKDNKQSIFSDPSYGSTIFKKDAVNSIKNKVVIDIASVQLVTGLSINNIKTFPNVLFTIKTSADNKNWNTVVDKQVAKNNWEIPVLDFKSGAQVPGINTRYISIQSTKPFACNGLSVLGKNK